MELQQQHTDLLSLLAQQEVELDTFREKVSELLNDDYLFHQVEEQAQSSVIKLYGTYVNYRQASEYL